MGSELYAIEAALARSKAERICTTEKCSTKGCKGERLYPHQEVEKKIVDAKYKQVHAWRYECAECGHTFRVHPQDREKAW
jgi:hypothetical protein